MCPTIAVDGLRILPTQHSVPQVLQRVESLARARGLTVFAQIDFSGDAERSGVALLPTGLVILGNPKAGTPLMAATPTAAIDLPLKILAWQDAEGRRWVAYNEAEYLRARHGFPAELVRNISALGVLAAAAAAPDP
ncbi:MAG: DUF302 domain-containing protein [Steroidobacteraceae bacterium]